MLVHVYSGRRGINVMLPGTQYRGEGNHWFARGTGPVEAQILDAIRATIEEEGARGAYCRSRNLPNGHLTWSTTEEGAGLGPWAQEPEGEWVTTYGSDGRWSRMEHKGAWSLGPVRGYRGEYSCFVTVGSPEPVER